MTLERCFSTLGCPERTLPSVLALAREFQIPAVEIRALAGRLDLAGVLTETYGTPDRLGRELAESPVRVRAFDASLRLAGGSAEQREELLALAPWAEAVGVCWLRVFDGLRSLAEEELAAAAETLDWWNTQRANRGWRVQLMVETHDVLVTAAAITRLRERAPEVAILWDAHHTWRKGGEDPVETWRVIRDAVVHVHVKDSIAEPSARHPFTYVLPGDGGFPIARVREELARAAFSGPVSLEWERVWHPYLPPLDAALREAAGRGWW